MPDFYPKATHTSFVGEDYEKYEIPPDVQLEACIKGADFAEQVCEEYDHVAAVDFELPIINTLFFLSRGDTSFGCITATSSPKQPPGVASVEITARYKHDKDRNQIRVLLLNRGDDSKGFGVFTPISRAKLPGHFSSSATLRFDIKITFPEGTEEHPFSIPNFHSNAPQMTHTFEELSKVIFTGIDVSSSNHPISVKFLRVVERGAIETSNAPISGKFESSGNIQLSTSNARILIDANLHSSEGDTILSTTTSNAIISVRISAYGQPGSFNVQAETSNAKLKIDFEEAPASSVMKLGAVTSNGTARVTLPPTFEGKFTATTTPPFPATSTVGSEEGKEMYLQLTESRTEGLVGCASDRGVGMVDVKTSNGPVTVHFR